MKKPTKKATKKATKPKARSKQAAVTNRAKKVTVAKEAAEVLEQAMRARVPAPPPPAPPKTYGEEMDARETAAIEEGYRKRDEAREPKTVKLRAELLEEQLMLVKVNARVHHARTQLEHALSLLDTAHALSPMGARVMRLFMAFRADLLDAERQAGLRASLVTA